MEQGVKYELEIIKGVIGKSAILVNKNNITYICKLFPKWSSNGAILICKKVTSPVNAEHHKFPEIKDEYLEATDHDVTGSPLKHSFGDENFDITIAEEKRNWLKDEENYLPLEKLEASALLNRCIDKLGTKWSMPLFSLCNGTDEERTVLLGVYVDSLCFHTHKAVITGIIGSSTIYDCSSIMHEHLMMSSALEHEVNIEVSSTYEFCGVNQCMIDWSEREQKNFEGFLSLELHWDSLSFHPPSNPTSSYVIAQIAAGRRGSPLNDLWDQLLLLDKYLTIFEAYQEKNLSSRNSIFPLIFPKDFSTPYIKEPEYLLQKLNLLLNGDDDFYANDVHDDPISKRFFSDEAGLDENAPLHNYLKELSSRENTDFTEKLWQLIVSSSDYTIMTECLHTVFENIVNNLYKPEINEAQPTRLANFIHDLTSRKTGVPQLAGSLALELVIDMGIEKMSRDYKYLLLSANLVNFHSIQEKLANVPTDKFNTNDCRKRLMTMAQIHICLEFLLLVQNNLNCSLEISCSLFDSAMKQYTSSKSPIKCFTDLIGNTIYTLKSPGSKAMLKVIGKTSPSWWRASLSSHQKFKSLSTTTHYSLVPIFPPNVYTPDDPIEGEESFYVTKVVSSEYKVISDQET